MRAGRLKTPATLLELNADLQRVEIDWLWCGIQTKERAEPPFPSSLRSPVKVAIRAWFDGRVRQGRYLEADGRLFLIDSSRDFDSSRAELAITATEFVGECGTALPAGQPARTCRVFLQHEAPMRDELGQVTAYKTRAEVALIEAGRLQAGYDQLSVGGVTYNVVDYDASSDDGIVRGLWLEPVE